MSSREHILNFFTRFDIPLFNPVLPHLLFPLRLEPLAFSDAFRHFEGLLGLETLLNQKGHNVVSDGDHVFQRGVAAFDIIFGVVQPDVGAMRQTRNTQQLVKRAGLGHLQHSPDKSSSKFGNRRSAGFSKGAVVVNMQRLQRGKNRHSFRVVQRNFSGVDAGQILQRPDHRGIFVPQHIEF